VFNRRGLSMPIMYSDIITEAFSGIYRERLSQHALVVTRYWGSLNYLQTSGGTSITHRSRDSTEYYKGWVLWIKGLLAI